MAEELPVMVAMDENWAKDVTPTLTVGTPVSGYSASYLSNGNAAQPLLLQGKLITARWDLGTAKIISRAAILASNFDAGLTNVKIKIGNDGSYATFDAEETFDIPERDAAGFSVDPHVDFTQGGSPGGSPLELSCRYVQVSATTANSINLQIGEIWFGRGRELPHSFLMRSPRPALAMKTVVHETTKGVFLTYSRGIERHSYVGTILGSLDDIEAVKELFQLCGGMAKRCLWIHQPSINVARLYHWADVFESPQVMGQVYSAQLTFIESSRGLTPPTT